MAAYVLNGFREAAGSEMQRLERNARHASFVSRAAGAVRDWFADPLFWDLYDAERSEDLQAMTKLHNRYSMQ